MKTLKYILSAVLLLAIAWACTKEDDFGSLDFVSTAEAPTNVTALYSITQDNTGLVTITPYGDGANSFDIYLGDGSTEAINAKLGENISHIYAEGNYTPKIIAYNSTGLSTEVTEPLVVSFKAPENLVVTIENDEAISQQVNVTVTADFATFFEVYFGETTTTKDAEEPVTANIGGTASYTYQEVGTYTIRVVAKGGAIATTEYTEEFLVTKILQPIESAPTPSSRLETDVISIFSDAYDNIGVSEWNPGWGQSTVLTDFTIGDDNILKYDYLNYSGIVTDYGNPTDLSGMEFVHFDFWTNDAETFGLKIVNTNEPEGATKESEVVITDITEGEWVSVDIPLTDYTTNMTAITQLVLSSSGVTVFIDNFYFYKAPTEFAKLPLDFESAVQTFDVFNGATFAIGVDPEDANNPVGVITNAGAGWGWEGVALVLDEAIDLSLNSNIKMDFYTSTTDHAVLLKLEDANGGSTEISQPVTTTGWSELTFELPSTATFNKVVIFVDGGVEGISGDYYIDNIAQVGVSDGPAVTPITFENGFGISSFDGGDISLVSNPDATGNTSAMVAKLVKGAGQVWAGSKITVEDTYTFTGGTTVTAKVWSPRAGMNLLMKFEDATPWPSTVASAEVVATTTVANQWEELTFDFSGISTSVDFVNLVLIMDNGTAGDGGDDYTIYIDDISAKSSLDFEIGKSLSSFDGGVLTVVGNPDATGNTSSMVAKLVKGAGQVWAGSKITSPEAFSFANSTTVKVKVYSPRAGLNLLMKFEDATGWPNTVASAEVVGTTTVANEWEELTFDFSGISTDVDFVNLVFIMDNGTAGDGSADYTIYLDDISQN